MPFILLNEQDVRMSTCYECLICNFIQNCKQKKNLPVAFYYNIFALQRQKLLHKIVFLNFVPIYLWIKICMRHCIYGHYYQESSDFLKCTFLCHNSTYTPMSCIIETKKGKKMNKLFI